MWVIQKEFEKRYLPIDLIHVNLNRNNGKLEYFIYLQYGISEYLIYLDLYTSFALVF